MSRISGLLLMTVIIAMFSCLHLRIEAQVHCNVTLDEGNADLTCMVPSDTDIVQVTWQKKTGNSYETLVTNSKRFGVKISKPYENRVSVLQQTKDLGTSAIALTQLEKEDDACFTAIFNKFPEGSLKGEVCLPKLPGVREVICKSPAEFSVTLDPPRIKTQHLEQNGNIIQKGRWLNGDAACNFQQEKKARTRRNFQEGNEIFTIECNASGTERPTITWINEGQLISKEEKVNITGDLTTVTSTRRYSWSTLPEGETIRCNISYDKVDIGFNNEKVKEENQELTIVRIIVPSILLAIAILFVVICGVWYLKRKQPNSLKNEEKAEKELSTPLKHQATPSTVLIDQVMPGTPGSETKLRIYCNPEKNEEEKKSVKSLFF